MKTEKEIKAIFNSLSGDEQARILEELLQEHELQGKILESATTAVNQYRGKKPCPYCASEKVYKRGKQNTVQMYQCQSESCKKWYSETTGTPLWDIKLKSKWQGYLRCMEQGMSLKASAEELKISIQTSFDWRHKILSSLSKFVPQTLSGVVESDEFEIALSHKGQRNLERKPRKRGTDFKRNTQEKEVTVVQVVTAVERGGETYLKAVESKRLTAQEIAQAFDGKLTQGTVLITDSHKSYKKFAKQNPTIKHKTCIAKDYTDKEDKKIHVQTVNNKHKKLKQFLDPFNGVSSKYLQNYLNWFAYAEKLRQTKHTIKQWIISGILASNAYEFFLLFKQNAVNIRI
jgi:transposase-like protein